MARTGNRSGCGAFGSRMITFLLLLLPLLYGIVCHGFVPLPAQAADAVPAMSADGNPASPTLPRAEDYTEKGRQSFRKGKLDDAIASWEKASKLWADEGVPDRQCETLILLSQALQMTGQYGRAIKSLERAGEIAAGLNNPCRRAAADGSLGNAYLGMGDVKKASESLQSGLDRAKAADCREVAAVILNNIGNLRVAGGSYGEAAAAYRQSAELAQKTGDRPLLASALINAATLDVKTGRYAEARSGFDRALEQLEALDDSQTRAYGLINAGIGYDSLRGHPKEKDGDSAMKAYRAFSSAAGIAERSGDERTASYAYGYMGRLYEERLQLQEALDVTRRAVFLAQKSNSPEALYRWQWQCGRILRKQGKADEAIVAYRLAVQQLQAIRSEFSSCYANPEYTYRNTAGTVCFELVSLLLERASALRAGESSEPFLFEVREALELLKLYELRDYFKDDCVDAARTAEVKIDDISKKTVVIYPILLKDRLELVVTLSGSLRRYTQPVSAAEVSEQVNLLRKKMEKRTTWEFLPHATRLYDWIVRPLEKDLDAVKPDTIVIIPDGSLRTIPLAALYDGKQFLISRYSIATIPSLNLADPRPVKRENSRVLGLGITDSVQGYPGLPFVEDEMKALRELYPGDYLLNRDFSIANVEKELKTIPFSMVHIASHGHFGSEVGDTYVLAYSDKLTMDLLFQYIGLFRFREEPLDLLTLSACETAAGDERAALGLAGIAVRAGARSALATLWNVNDPASYEIIREFYGQLRNPAVSRAAALRAAQMKLIEDPRYDHPGYWSPFLLINNWL